MDAKTVYIFPDPVVRAIGYLSNFYPNVASQEPDGTDYQPEAEYVLVKDAGGRGVRGYAYQDARLSFETRAPDRGRASEIAAEVSGLLRQWRDDDSSVIVLDDNDTPKYFPDEERHIEAYTFMYGFSFRGKKKTVNPL